MDRMDLIKEKTLIIAKELDTGFQVYERWTTQVLTLRGWTLTLVLAYIALLGSIQAHNARILVTLLIVLLFFLYLEADLKSQMDWLHNEICEVLCIFMETDPEKFTNLVLGYKFRDLKIRRDAKIRDERVPKLSSSFKYMLEPRVFSWYLLLFVLAGAGYFGIFPNIAQTK